jgi:hypothetical protein
MPCSGIQVVAKRVPGARVWKPLATETAARFVIQGGVCWQFGAAIAAHAVTMPEVKDYWQTVAKALIEMQSIGSKQPYNPPTTRLGPGCHPCLRYVLLPCVRVGHFENWLCG